MQFCKKRHKTSKTYIITNTLFVSPVILSTQLGSQILMIDSMNIFAVIISEVAAILFMRWICEHNKTNVYHDISIQYGQERHYFKFKFKCFIFPTEVHDIIYNLCVVHFWREGRAVHLNTKTQIHEYCKLSIYHSLTLNDIENSTKRKKAKVH